MKFVEDRTYADKILKHAALQNPGSWVEHSLNVAVAAERIATALHQSGHDINDKSPILWKEYYFIKSDIEQVIHQSI